MTDLGDRAYDSSGGSGYGAVPPPHEDRLSLRTMFVVSVLGTLLLFVVPGGAVVGLPLMLLSTMAHELGHGVAAIVAGGSFLRLELWADGSGQATFAGASGRFQIALVAAGGLIGPAVAATCGFLAATRSRWVRPVLLVCAGSLVVAIVLVVRNLFAASFFLLVALTLLALVRFASVAVSRLVVVFLSVQLALSVFSRSDYLFTPVAMTGAGASPSDVAMMAQALFLPYWFWGGLCGVASGAVLAFGLAALWNASEQVRDDPRQW